MSADPQIIYPNPETRDSLVFENVPDPLDGEQTWPTEEEIAEAEERIREMEGFENENEFTLSGNKFNGGKVVKRVPKGTSAYQAAWIIDSDEENENSYDESDNDNFGSDNEDDAMGEITLQKGNNEDMDLHSDKDNLEEEQEEEEENDEYENIEIGGDAEAFDKQLEEEEEKQA